VIPGPFLGAWIDRRERKPVMIAANIASAVLIGSIPVAAWLGTLSMAQLYVAGYLAGVCGQASDLARQALMPPLIGRDRLVQANSQMQVSGAVTQIAGPSLGGILVQALTAPVAMAFDALSFVVSALVLAFVRVRETVHPRAEGARLWHDVTEGMRFVREQDLLFRSVVAIALANIEWFAVQAILVVYATDELHLPPALLGVALAAIGPASLVGATLAVPLASRFGLGRVMIVALLFEAVSRLLLPFIFGAAVQAAILLGLTQALVGLTEALWFVGLRTLQQSVTPDRLLGRVGAASNFVQFVVAPPAAFAAGVLGDAIGLRPTLFIQGVIALIALVYLYASPIRAMRSVPIAADELVAAPEHG
jgi:predicted MFS family arabinose efflux permease